MNHPVLADTGPLVALLNRSDSRHAAATEALVSLRTPLFTCWPVLTEAAYLLRSQPAAVRSLLSSIDSGFLQLLPLGPADIEPISDILEQYEDQSFQLADAVLMYLADREAIPHVFTFDRRDFSVFRTRAGKSLTLMPASGD